MDSESVNKILFEGGDRRRFTQETPILPEVWYNLARAPDERHDLLITPLNTVPAHKVLLKLLEQLEQLPGEAAAEACPVALRGFVAVRLTFDEIIDFVLPRTQWAWNAVDRWKKGQVSFGDADPPADARALDSRGRPSDKEIRRIFELIAAITLERAAQRANIGRSRKPTPKALDARGRDLMADVAGRVPESCDDATIWRVTMNRTLDLSDDQARSTVKGDAAYRVFDMRCDPITWGVIDSGIDSSHPAFNDLGPDNCRIRKTYDFTTLRPLLNGAFRNNPAANPQLAPSSKAAGISIEEGVKWLSASHRALETDSLDWRSIEALIVRPKPEAPVGGHGTHVAGIIGANWREEDGTPIVVGLCPDINLYDFRIISRDKNAEEARKNTEFAVIAALQFVRYLNSRNQHIAVHGLNLSLSIAHVVENYACGRTPVCEECERLVGSGVSVVAAAGNQGYHGFATKAGEYAGYSTVSITDPGNAETVITVGATHKREPHAYGVSYFSSRGPTADGRAKPDLVAPGERIRSTLPDGEYGPLDGTSQAAPHVSGAAALLMARFPELIGQPLRIKKLLCESATDLGRERSFQGHGLLDILRALQSF
ncbi:MAG: S8 family peptidase [Pseudomonadota bacterium]